MNENRDNILSPDRPLQPSNEDRLDFQSLAKSLAASILEHTGNDGLVIGIEGSWGAGKTSLVNLLQKELESDLCKPLTVKRFDPWLIGNRDSLLFELMSDLSSAIQEIEGPSKRNWFGRRKRSDTIKKLAVYVSKTAKGVSPLVHLAGLAGVPLATTFAQGTDSLGKLADNIEISKPLSKVKDELATELQRLKNPILVVVDDIDRLEPLEIAEVLRLIRAVADFPNIIYLICYDRKVIDHAISRALDIESGADFFEKLVQVSFRLPRPEAFDLRNWFLEECQGIYAKHVSEQMDSYTFGKLNEVCQLEGSCLRNPRDVKIVTNNIMFHFARIHDVVFFPDLVWLHLIRTKDREFYDLIEEYLIDFAAMHGGANIAESELKQFGARFRDVLESELGWNSRSAFMITRYMPGLKWLDKDGDDKDIVFNTLTHNKIKELEERRRISSPQHYRYYFSFSEPKDLLKDEIFDKLICDANSGQDLSITYSELLNSPRVQGGHFASLLLDRLLHLDYSQVSITAKTAIMNMLADVMDESARIEGQSDFGRYQSWGPGSLLYYKITNSLSAGDARSLVLDNVANGNAMSWIMDAIIRREADHHGRIEKSSSDESEWLLSDPTLDEANNQIITRLQGPDQERVLKLPNLLSFLFGWLQAGDVKDVEAWVRRQMDSTETFIALLEGCRGWMQSDKVYHPLRRRDLKHFLDTEEIEPFLQRTISEDGVHAPKAAELLDALDVDTRMRK